VTSYPLVRPSRLSLVAFSRQAGLHPELIRRFVALGLLDPSHDAHGDMWFAPTQLVAIARIQRLHHGLGLNYAALGLVVELLDRIWRLETEMRDAHRFHPTPQE
jgi:chaperone modulatory protein CbpM